MPDQVCAKHQLLFFPHEIFGDLYSGLTTVRNCLFLGSSALASNLSSVFLFCLLRQFCLVETLPTFHMLFTQLAMWRPLTVLLLCTLFCNKS